MRKNLHSKILREKPNEQYLNIILKSYLILIMLM